MAQKDDTRGKNGTVSNNYMSFQPAQLQNLAQGFESKDFIHRLDNTSGISTNLSRSPLEKISKENKPQFISSKGIKTENSDLEEILMNLDDYEDDKKSVTKVYDRVTTLSGSNLTPIGKQNNNITNQSPKPAGLLSWKSVKNKIKKNSFD